MRCQRVLLWFGVCHAGFAHAGIQSILMESVEQLPVELRTVETCGNWKHGGRAGYYRLVVGDVYKGVGSEVYVQWIENPTEETSAKVVATLTFPEINDDHNQYYFTQTQCVKAGRHYEVKLVGFYEHDDFEREHELRIRLIDIGRYEIRRKIKHRGKVRESGK